LSSSASVIDAAVVKMYWSDESFIKLNDDGNLKTILQMLLGSRRSSTPEKDKQRQITFDEFIQYHKKFKVNMYVFDGNGHVRFESQSDKYRDYVLVIEQERGYYSLLGVREDDTDEIFFVFDKDDRIIRKLKEADQ